MTSLFSRFPSSEFAPFFRLLDVTDPFLQPRPQHRSFVPRFDVREVGSAYELHGELPGIEQSDIDIEFVDANTLVIRGKSEHHTTRTNEETKAVDEQASHEPIVADNASEKSSPSYHKATVEDDYVDAGAPTEGTESLATTNTINSNASQTADTQAVTTKTDEPSYKYWVSERSAGTFERRFSFPGRVDQEAVKASLKNGILSVIVPKAVRAEKKITIE